MKPLNNAGLHHFFIFFFNMNYLDFSSFFHLQDEKNQVLMTNAWLQLVSHHSASGSRKSLSYVLVLTESKTHRCCDLDLDLCMCLSQYWTDIYLTWNPENYPGVQNLRFPSDQVWTPDILLYNRSELFPLSELVIAPAAGCLLICCSVSASFWSQL